MGNTYMFRRYITERELAMDPDAPPTFDPHLGFNGQRKKREMIATKEEMIACKIPPDMRDYCAHLLIKVEACRADNFPWVKRCAPEKTAYEDCLFEDYVLRMKEYERERRLRRLALKNQPVAA